MKKDELRCFLAIRVTGSLANRLERENSYLKLSGASCGWTAARNMHITLRFLGEVQPTEVLEIARVIEAETTETSATRIILRGLQMLPEGAKKPRLVACGIEGDLEPLHDLYDRLQKALAPLGFRPEKKGWHPHVTLARLKNLDNLDQLLERVEKASWREFGHLQVGEIDLMMSDLEVEGPIYTPLQTFPLLG